MNQLNNSVEIEKEITDTFDEDDTFDWDKYKDDKVSAKPRITIADGGICISCEG